MYSPPVVSLLGAPWWALSGQRTLRVIPVVAWLPTGSPMSDRSKVMTQKIYDIFVNCNWVRHPVAVVQYTFTRKQYIEQHKNKFGRVRAVPRLCGLYPGICLTTEGKARKNLSQGSRRVPAGTMKIHKHTITTQT